MTVLSAPMDDDFWTRLERAVAVDDHSCACTMAGPSACSRHAVAAAAADPADTAALADPACVADAAGMSAQASFRTAWRAAVLVAAVLTIGSVGLGAARALSRSGGSASVADAVRPAQFAAGARVADAVPPAASGREPGVELPPMNMSNPARLALLGASIGSLAGGLCLGLTRRDRPARHRRVGSGMDGSTSFA